MNATASFKTEVNFDTLLRQLLADMSRCAREWAEGVPRDEIALLNRMTARLRHQRRRCDVGVKEPITMTAEFYELHRKGEGQTDKFGADFAVTVSIRQEGVKEPSFLKTSLFQLKKSSGYIAELKRSQLEDAVELHELKDRTFVLSVDETRLGYRIQSVEHCLEAFDNQAVKSFHTEEWESLSDWLSGWFACQRGQTSDPEDPRSVEHLLESFQVPPPENHTLASIRENLPQDWVPPKCWLKCAFMKAEQPS